MIITDFKAGKRDKNRIHVYMDGTYKGTVYIDYLIECHYKIGDEVSEEAFNQLLEISLSKRLLNLSLRYVGVRQRSEQEIIDYLNTKAFKEGFKLKQEARDEIIKTLKKYSYVNDKVFANIWTKSRIAKGVGPKKLRLELQAKGISKNIIEEVLSQIEDNSKSEAIEKLSEKFLRNKIFDSENEKQWKLKQYLYSKGF